MDLMYGNDQKFISKSVFVIRVPWEYEYTPQNSRYSVRTNAGRVRTIIGRVAASHSASVIYRVRMLLTGRAISNDSYNLST